MNLLSFLAPRSGLGRIAAALLSFGLFSAVADAQSVSRFAQTVNVVNGWNYETEAQGAPAGFDCNSTPETYAVQPSAQFSTAWLTASAFPSFNIPAGDDITSVQARILLRFDINKSGQIDVDARLAGAWNVVSNNFNVPAQGTGNCVYQTWTVSAPAGGWTLADVQNLGLRVRRTTNTTNSGNFRVKAFELIVSHQTPPPPPSSMVSFCEDSVCPCGNTGLPGRGCNNSSNTGGARLDATGNPSYTNDTVVLTATGLPLGTLVYLVEGFAAPAVPFGDGRLCLTNYDRIWDEYTSTGTFQVGALPTSTEISWLSYLADVGVTTHYQVAYLDYSPSYCSGRRFNFTQGYAITWLP
jgi:hypothetical protein